MEKINNEGCRYCRYYAQTTAQCINESAGFMQVKEGLIGKCYLFKPYKQQQNEVHNGGF
jgi:hypothetical protein